MRFPSVVYEAIRSAADTGAGPGGADTGAAWPARRL